MTRPRLFLSAAALVSAVAACTGPEAPDADLCRDVVHRMCLARTTCETIPERLSVGEDCEAVLRERTGCGAEDFTFGTPSRDAFLDCRATLVRSSGVHPEAVPACEDVQATFDQCPELVTFLEAR